MVSPTSHRMSLVDAAVHHLAAHAPPNRPMAIFLSVGAGAASEALASRFREALAARIPVTWSTASLTPDTPLPTSPTGTHVHSERSSLSPWPDRVVRVASDGTTESIAVRLPGSDPLGPAEAGWEWFETRP